MKADVNVKL